MCFPTNSDDTPLPPEQPVSASRLYQHVRNDPRLQPMAASQQPEPPVPSFMGRRSAAEANGNEGAALADPFGVMSIKRAFGADIPGMFLINESHGVANKEAYRQRYGGSR